MGIGDVLAPVLSPLGTAIAVPSMAARHVLDTDIAFGLPSKRWDMRGDYRNTYSDDDRFGAALGDAGGTVIPAIAAWQWSIKRGAASRFIVPHVPQKTLQVLGKGFNPYLLTGRAAAVGVLGTSAIVGAGKVHDRVIDDGHYGSLGAAAGITLPAAGALAISNHAGKSLMRRAPLLSVAAAIAGGIGGFQAGEHLLTKLHDPGPSHVKKGEASPDVYKPHNGLPGSVADFAMATSNHFTEAGPFTQGISFASKYGAEEDFQGTYTDTERGGAMFGELVATAYLGGGALAAGRRVLSQGEVTAPATRLGRIAQKGTLSHHMLNGMQAMSMAGSKTGGGLAMTTLAGGLMVGSAYAANQQTGFDGVDGIVAGATLAAAVPIFMKARNAQQLSHMTAAKPAAAALSTAILVSALSAARYPAQLFVNHAETSHKLSEGVSTEQKVAMAGIGAVGGGVVGFKTAKGFIEAVSDKKGLSGMTKVTTAGRFGRIPPAGKLAIGTVVGAALMGGAGLGVSAASPDPKGIAISAGAGALALGGLNALVSSKGRGRAGLMGGVVGAMVGAAASPVLSRKAAPPVVPAGPVKETPVEAPAPGPVETPEPAPGS